MMRAKNIARKKVLCFNPTGAIIPNQEEQEEEGAAAAAAEAAPALKTYKEMRAMKIKKSNVEDPHHHRHLHRRGRQRQTQESGEAQGIHLEPSSQSKWRAMKLNNSPLEASDEGELETLGPPPPSHLSASRHLSENELLPLRQRNHGKFQESLLTVANGSLSKPPTSESSGPMEALMSMTGVTATSQEPGSTVQNASKIKEELAKRILDDQDKPMDKVTATATAQAMAMKSFLEKLNMNFALNPPPQIEMRASKVRSGSNVLGVWAKEEIPSGMRYGPFLGKWALDVTNKDFAWEVLVPSAGIRGFLDASEYGSWLKHVQCVPEDNPEQQNITYTMVEGQIYYETLRDIREGAELALGPKRSIILDQNDNASTNGLGLDSSKGSNFLDRPEGSSEDGTIDRDEHHHSEGEDTTHAADGEEDDEDDDESGAKCIKCEKVFPDISLLDHHMVEAHSHTPSQYRCEHCSESFAWRPNLLRHKMIHGEFRRFPCENCDKVFTDPSNLQRHIRTNHVGARSHACPECGKTFATSSGLKQHTHIHSSVKPFRCEVCFKSYTQFSNLCRHKRMHANCRMQIKCHKCGQAFSTVTSLSKHRRFCDSTPSPYLALAASAHHSSSTNGGSLSPKLMKTSSATSSPLSKMSTDASSHDFSSIGFGKSLGTPTTPTSSLNASGAGLGLNSSHGHSLAMSQAAAASLLSPYAAAHFLQQKHHQEQQQQQQQQSTNALAALAMAGVQNPFANFFQSPHLLLPNVLHRLANQQQLLSQSHGFPVGLPGSLVNGNRPQSLSPPSSSLKRKASERSAIIERPWLDKKRLIEERPKRLSHDGSVEENRTVNPEEHEAKRESPSYSKSVRLTKGTDGEDNGEDVDVNRNVSLEEKHLETVKTDEEEEAVERQRELVLKSKESENGFKIEPSDSSDIGPALDLSRSNLKPCYGKTSFPQGIRPVKEDILKRSHGSEPDEEEIEEPEEDEEIDDMADDDDDNDNENNEEDGEDFEKGSSDPERPIEPKGFQPVKEGKVFVPVKEKVEGFLARKRDHQHHQQTRHHPHQHPHHQADEERFGGDRFSNSHALEGAGHFSPKSFSSSPASYPPRPIHPFLLEAMYRMHHRPSPGTESATTPFPGIIADHGTLNGNASVPPRFPSYFPPSSMMMSGSRALEERSFFPSRCYPDLIAGMGSKSNKDRYSCKFCGKVFPRSANLTRHLRTHTGEQPYKCKYCERSFSISSNLQRHVRNIHNKEKPFKCPLCDRSFGQQTNLDRHLKKHETCSDPSAIVDSPEGPRGAEEEGYFDEIRSFMDKVTDQPPHPFSSEYSPRHSDADIDVEDEEDEISLEQE